MRKLNGPWHERANLVFGAIVIGHWAVHLLQAWQIWGLHWPRARALGALGYFYPELVRTEALHYGYALVMLIGLWMLRPGFVGRSLTWWTISLGIQFWHHIEHLLLQIQVIIHHNFFGRAVPTSIVQLWFPRVELHLFYNSIVFVPMVVAMYYHLLPSDEERAHAVCSCALKLPPAAQQLA
jgi:hypothetical protein